MANYNDPALQRLLLRRVATNPYGGVANRSPEIDAYVKQQEGRKLALSSVGLQSKLNKARIENMQFEQGMSEKEMGLKRGYMDIAQRRLGLGEKAFGLSEKEFGLSERGFGIRSEMAALRDQEAAWRNSMATKKLDSQESALDLQTILGLGTAGYAAYEGSRRAGELRKDQEETKAWRRRVELQNMGIGAR